jgi:hypothetical protein
MAMKLRLHNCTAEGCQRVISTLLLMCVDHWRMVPAPLRREVLELHKLVRRSGRDRDLVTRYRDAVDRAVATVREKQERKAASEPSGSLFNQV